jgi:type IV pilus assembly protein PilC
LAQFKYTALSKDGQKVTGLIDAFNEMDAAVRVKENNSVILKLTDVSEKGAGALGLDLGAGKLNAKAFTVMCSQFAIILKAGVPLARAVQLIAEKTADKNIKRMLRQVASDVEGGRTLSAAFEEHGGKMLPPTFVETLRAGEESGSLDQSFKTMHEHFDKQVKMAAKVRGALAYPVFVLALTVIVVIVLLVKVVPVFAAVFAEGGGQMPLSTRILLGISGFFQHNILLIIGVIAALVVAFLLYGHTENGRMNLAKLALKLPVFGNINMLTAASQFANSMTSMLEAGLPLVKSVNITARTISNYYLSQQTGKLSGELETGRTLSDAMREQNVMPDILVDMVGVGENTGELAGTLGTIAQFYDAELEDATQKALASLEPALLIVIAVVAGFVVIAMYSAMFSMYGSMG